MQTLAELTILSLLAEAPHHGYGLEQVIEERGMREWTAIGFSSIYYTLKKLEKLALINSKLETHKGPGPASKVYSISDEGRAVWHKEILFALSSNQIDKQPLLLAISTLHLLAPAEVNEALLQREQALSQHLQGLEAQLEATRPHLPFHVVGMYDLSLNLIRTEHDWIQQFRQTYSLQAHQDA